jgi:hypothetical protein
MKTFLRFFLFLSLTPMLFAAEDTGWRQPGVRVWYIGASASYTGQSDAEEANLIQQGPGNGLRVLRHQAVGFWSAPLPASTLDAPNPTSEGPFWISPARLQKLHSPDAFSWQGLSLIVKARVTYQNADDLPFIAYLPVQALYAAKSPRELITLTGENDGVIGDYFFDVETGLGLSSTLNTPGFYIMMMLAEINYDFATHQAFAEDNGPHTGYRAGQGAGRMEWPISQFYLFEERVTSRYRQAVRTDLTLGIHNIATGQSFQGDYYSLFDGETRQFAVTPITASLAAATTWTVNGTHGFFWIPPGDFLRDTIRVWDLDLAHSNEAIFAASTLPADWGFTRLEFDPDGFVSQMRVQSATMSFDVDSVTATASKTNYFTGRSYYLQTMSNAVPSGVSVSNLSILKMKATKRITLKGLPVTKLVTVTVQNLGTGVESIDADMVKLDVISLGSCTNPVATIVSPVAFPVLLKPKKKLSVKFAVTYNCANDPLATTKTAAHWDYRYAASLTVADSNLADNICPRDPSGTDKGCGNKDKATGLLGADVMTDVVVKQ